MTDAANENGQPAEPKAEPRAWDRFRALTKRLLGVPKAELDKGVRARREARMARRANDKATEAVP